MSAIKREKDHMLISVLLKSNLLDLYGLLQNYNINPALLKDAKGNTALHISALNNSFSQIEFLIRYVEEYYSKDCIKEWVNECNDEKYTLLHMVANRGNIETAELLIKKGAELNALTKHGLTMMHMAAQGDQISFLAYFKELGLSFTQTDYEGATPLHWAAYLGCELASATLISWNAQLNCVDNQGFTPIHLASIAGNPRITRLLLIKGAEPNVSDFKGRTPLHFAKEYGFIKIIELLNPPTFLALCGIKPPQRPIKYKRFLMVLFILMLACGNFTNIYLIQINSLDYLCAAGLQALLFLVIVNKDPGFIGKKHEKLLKLCRENQSIFVCAECVVKRVPRSRHCQSCARCVEKFDHHCPWINQCVGAKNIGIFFLFICSTLFLLILGIFYDGLFLYSSSLSLSLEILDYSLPLLVFFLLLIELGFFFPLILLIWVQLTNILTNTTTNERYSRNPETRAERSDSDENVDRGSVCKNICQMCCNTGNHDEGVGSLKELSPVKFTAIESEYRNSKKIFN